MGRNFGLSLVKRRTLSELSGLEITGRSRSVYGATEPLFARETEAGTLFLDSEMVVAADLALLQGLSRPRVDCVGVMIGETSGTFALTQLTAAGIERLVVDSEGAVTDDDALLALVDPDGEFADQFGYDRFCGYFFRLTGVDVSAAMAAEDWVAVTLA